MAALSNDWSSQQKIGEGSVIFVDGHPMYNMYGHLKYWVADGYQYGSAVKDGTDPFIPIVNGTGVQRGYIYSSNLDVGHYQGSGTGNGDGGLQLVRGEAHSP